MKKILIIGATSAIAGACARQWAEEGNALFLVARNCEHLETLSKDLKVRGASLVSSYCMDINNVDSYMLMFNQVRQDLGIINIALLAHGTLSNQLICERSILETLQEIQTNALSTVCLLTLLANQFEMQKSGLIAVLSSVAGDRGRKSNYVYGSAKAMVNTFMSGLRQRLSKYGVSVLTIKPGFIDTPMTAQFKKNFLWVKPESIAKTIVKKCNQEVNGEIYVPLFWWAIMLTIKSVPISIYRKLSI